MSPPELWGTTDAVLSPCGRYRYSLARRWGPEPLVLWLMLNPSTADATTDDATVRRCCGFARRWGHGGIVVGNLYAWRTTDPRGLGVTTDPVGPDNDAHLARLLASPEVGRVVAAWGTHASAARATQVRVLAGLAGRRLEALGLTKAGHPRHPLYLPQSITPAPLPD